MPRKRFIAVAAGLALSGAAPAQAVTRTDVSVGYRIDELRWNIASDSSGTATPTILSELTWTDLTSLYFRYDGAATSASGWHARWGVGYGVILAGKNQDSDYAGDNRTAEFSRSNNDSEDGAVTDIDFAFGRMFAIKQVGILPLIGYTQRKQSLTITNGHQTIPATGDFGGLDSTYEAKWTAPWVGLELNYMFQRGSELFIRGAKYRGDYNAEADWNLRQDFKHPKSYEHEAKGEGRTLTLGWRYQTDRNRRFLLTLEKGKWGTEPGIDRTFFESGTVVETRLNEVEWTSQSINFGFWMRF